MGRVNTNNIEYYIYRMLRWLETLQLHNFHQSVERLAKNNEDLPTEASKTQTEATDNQAETDTTNIQTEVSETQTEPTESQSEVMEIQTEQKSTS